MDFTPEIESIKWEKAQDSASSCFAIAIILLLKAVQKNPFLLIYEQD